MKKLPLVIAVAAALSLAGCGGSQNTTEPVSSPNQTEAAPVSEPATEATPLSQEEWVEMCGPEGTDPENERCFEDQLAQDESTEISDYDGKQGEWVPFKTIGSDDMIIEWSIRIDSAEIVDVLENAADNPEYVSGDDLDAPERIDAKPEAGHRILHLEYSARNDSVGPEALPAAFSAFTSDHETFAPTGDDEDWGYNLTTDRDMSAGEEQNPRSETQGDVTIEILDGSEIEAVYVDDLYMLSEFSTAIELTSVK